MIQFRFLANRKSSLTTALTLGLLMSILDPTSAALADQKPRVAILTDEEAWARLPPTTDGTKPHLPVWARMLATEIPRTSAAYLQLDFAHRAASPLPAKLRAGMRWVAANAIR